MTSSCQDSDASLNFSSPATLNFSTPTVEDRELEMLIASIQTLKRGNKKCGKDEVFRLFRDSVNDVTKETFDKLLELLIQSQPVRLNIIENRECFSLPKQNPKLRENDENQEKPVLIMENIGNLRLQILEKFRNMKISFLTEVKSFINELLQLCVKHSPSGQVHANPASEVSERFLNYLGEQISFLREQLRNKDKVINSLINQLSKNSEVIQTPIINAQE